MKVSHSTEIFIAVCFCYTQIEAKDLQKMFSSHGIAKEVKIYLEHGVK